MKFWEAMKYLEEGQSIRSVDWEKDAYWYKSSLHDSDQWCDCSYRVYVMMQDEWELQGPKTIEPRSSKQGL